MHINVFQVMYFTAAFPYIILIALFVFGILVTLVAWFSFRFFTLQNVNKDYIIFLYFCNFVTKSDQKPKTKNGMNETLKVAPFVYTICMANIVLKKCFLFQVRIKGNCSWNCSQKDSHSFVPQIEPHPTSWHYPFINYLSKKVG